MKKDDLILSYSFVTSMNRKDHTTLDGKYMMFSEEVEKAIRDIARKHDQNIESFSDSLYLIHHNKEFPRDIDNAGKCVTCNEWVSAQNLPNRLTELAYGANYNDKFYCIDHLPEDSPLFLDLEAKRAGLRYLNNDSK